MKITYDLIKSFLVFLDISKDYSSIPSEFIKEYRNKILYRNYIFMILLRKEFMSSKDLRFFGLWCAKRVKHLIKNKRSINLINTAEKYSNGLATKEELGIARAYARSASYDFKGKLAMAVARVNAEEAAYDCYIYSVSVASWNVAKVFMRYKNDYNRDAYIARFNVDKTETDIILDKLLEYFISKENNQEFDWNK